MVNDNFLDKKLEERKQQSAYRQLQPRRNMADFCSNDYLGLVKNKSLSPAENGLATGSTGSRLLAGNYALIEETERFIAAFHEAEAGLIFNSGYDANIGLLSAVPQRGDTVLYDYLSHASLRDGIRLSFAQAFSFQHNDLEDLEKKIQSATGNIFVVTESVFSMDGDMAPLGGLLPLCERYDAKLIVDEAHATGVVGERGEGLVQTLGYADRCFARIHTFGKALGCHGAIVLGSERLKNYLINFSRAFIYTTALPESAVALIKKSYQIFPELVAERQKLLELITVFSATSLPFATIKNSSPIQAVIIPGNADVKRQALRLQQSEIDVRAILYPTVPKGAERLRIVLHSFNTVVEVNQLLQLIREAADNGTTF
jgi:8-amino-7-oxononanoate synthase